MSAWVKSDIRNEPMMSPFHPIATKQRTRCMSACAIADLSQIGTRAHAALSG
jgi:hypothetical protein